MTDYPIAGKRHNELYLYTNMQNCIAWAHDCQEFREYFRLGQKSFCVRAAHEWQGMPKGYRKGEGHGLANEPITRAPTMKDFINALKP